MSDSALKELSAVALTYPDYADAPLIAAKSKGDLARKMLEIAQENNIPVVHDSMLANVLSVQEVGACVPMETWQAVARVFAFILEMEKSEVK